MLCLRHDFQRWYSWAGWKPNEPNGQGVFILLNDRHADMQKLPVYKVERGQKLLDQRLVASYSQDLRIFFKATRVGQNRISCELWSQKKQSIWLRSFKFRNTISDPSLRLSHPSPTCQVRRVGPKM